MLVSTAEVKAFCSSLNSATYTTAIGVQIPIVIDFIKDYCNTAFTKYENGDRNVYTYASCVDLSFVTLGGTITDNTALEKFSTDNKFVAGDNIYISGSRNNDGYFTIKTIADNVITVETEETLATETSDRDYTIYILLVKWPKALKMVAAQMIEYDILRKFNTDKNIKSEHIGDYSVSFDSDIIGPYPKEILRALNVYRLVSLK